MSGTPGRNDACPCGSGKKFKKCCLAKHQEKARAEAKDLRENPPPPPPKDEDEEHEHGPGCSHGKK